MIIRSIVTYGCKSWTLKTEAIPKEIQYCGLYPFTTSKMGRHANAQEDHERTDGGNTTYTYTAKCCKSLRNEKLTSGGKGSRSLEADVEGGHVEYELYVMNMYVRERIEADQPCAEISDTPTHGHKVYNVNELNHYEKIYI